MPTYLKGTGPLSFAGGGRVQLAFNAVYNLAGTNFDAYRDRWITNKVTVTRTDVGKFTVQLPSPYPYSLVICTARVAKATGANVQLANYVRGSYSRTDGTFNLEVTGADGSAALEDLADDDELHVLAEFQQDAALTTS